jgi:hypothetical protein
MALWGSWDDNLASWSAVGLFSDPNVLSIFDDSFAFILNFHPSEVVDLKLHWAPLLRYLYAIGINDARIRLRELENDLVCFFIQLQRDCLPI